MVRKKSGSKKQVKGLKCGTVFYKSIKKHNIKLTSVDNDEIYLKYKTKEKTKEIYKKSKTKRNSSSIYINLKTLNLEVQSLRFF